MNKFERIFFGGVLSIMAVTLGFIARFLPQAQPVNLGAIYGNPAFVATSTATQATTTIFAFAGILHTVSITKPVSNSVITVCDSATSSSCGSAVMAITIPSSSAQVPFTLTVDGIFKNGLTILQGTATSTVSLSYQQN